VTIYCLFCVDISEITFTDVILYAFLIYVLTLAKLKLDQLLNVSNLNLHCFAFDMENNMLEVVTIYIHHM